MRNLTHAHHQLFRRTPDEAFSSLQALWEHCRARRDRSADRWRPPEKIRPLADGGRLLLDLGEGNEPFALNDWSFGQLCGLARVSKETVNRVSAGTGALVLQETLPGGPKPLQVFTQDDLVRSVHGIGYTRLHDVDVVTMLREFAVDFEPPPGGSGGGTGLYSGEQDLFAFLIDPTGWAEIEGEAFAPGFFVWNSEVGRRSVGVSTFWFQAVCSNHIVWDAIEVVEFTRKHTGQVHEALDEIRRLVEALVLKRDARRDSFVAVIRKAMATKLGGDADEALEVLSRAGIMRNLARQAIQIAQGQGRLTVYAVVDALTRLAGELTNAGDRTEADQRASALLSLAV
jgi:hypothetical protein